MTEVLWRPPANVRETTRIARFLTWLERERGLAFEKYDELHRWSVDDLDGFWSAVWEHFGVRSHTPYEAVLSQTTTKSPSLSIAITGKCWSPAV